MKNTKATEDDMAVRDDLANVLFDAAVVAFTAGKDVAIDPVVYHAQALALFNAGYRKLA